MIDIPKVEPTEVDFAAVDKFDDEQDFIGLAVKFLIEVGSHTRVLGNAMPADTKTWDDVQAIMGGHLVRLYKLISALLDQTCQHRRETSFMLTRMTFECIVNLKFLIKNLNDDLLFSYKAYSLKHEKKLMNHVKNKISERGGETLPIEERMLRSINKAFKLTGIDPEDVKSRELRNWGNKNIFEKADDVGLGELYLAAMGGPSHSIHGNWQDLLEYHLIAGDDGSFTPNFEWRQPRPQNLTTITICVCNLLIDYINWLGFEEIAHMVDEIEVLHDKVLRASKIHEDSLAKNAS